MHLMTKYFGQIDYDPTEVLSFPNGIFGFGRGEAVSASPLSWGRGQSALHFRALASPSLAFVAMNPFSLDPNYAPVLSDEELYLMGVSSSQDLCYYVLCVVREPVGESTVNLKCPIVIHAEEKKAVQVILDTGLIICATGFLSFDLRRRGLYADFASKGRRIACHRRSDQCDHPLGRRQRHRHAGHQCPKRPVLILRSELQQAASVNLDSANVDCVKLVEDLEKSLLHP